MVDLLSPQFQDADKAREYLEALRWPDGPICPHCGAIGAHYQIKSKTRSGLWKCKVCSQQFSVTVGTVFERSKIALNKWLLAVHLMCSSKKAVSSLQIHRILGVSYKSAWFMTHRIREAMKSEGGLMGSAGGIVESDETYWGNRGTMKKGAHGYQLKMKIVSLVDHEDEKRSFHLDHVSARTGGPILISNIDPAARLHPGELRVYKK